MISLGCVLRTNNGPALVVDDADRVGDPPEYDPNSNRFMAAIMGFSSFKAYMDAFNLAVEASAATCRATMTAGLSEAPEAQAPEVVEVRDGAPGNVAAVC